MESDEPVSCSIGDFIHDICNLTIYTTSSELVFLNQLSSEENELLLWRTGAPDTAVTVCAHHKEVYLKRYGIYRKKCCDPFQYHIKKPIKSGLQKVSLVFAKEIRDNLQIQVTPGQNICSRCRRQIRADISKLNEETEEMEGSGESAESIPGDKQVDLGQPSTSKVTIREDLDTSLKALGVTPIKLHSVPSHSKKIYAKNVVKKVKTSLKSHVARVLDIDESQSIDSSDTGEEECESHETRNQKVKDFDRLIALMKQRLPTVNRREKIQILTIAPESWPRHVVAKTFNVSEYMVRQARQLASSKGIFSLPEPRKGKRLPEETVQLVKSFYFDDEYSRQMPGAKDFVSIKKNEHKQKRLILCNLEELYAAFKEHHQDLKVGFSKFCSLRPKWCVLAGASGTHSVCVCTIHQNLELLLHKLHVNETSHDLIDKMVCNRENRDCMLGVCDKCPGRTEVKNFLDNYFHDSDDDSETEEMISFFQWVSVDRTQLINHQLPVTEFIELMLKSLEKLVPHSYITRAQSQYLKDRKANLENESAILLMDFAENYSFVIQDEVQGYHWTHASCTLHPVVIYHKSEEKLCEISICFISDDLDHDVSFVYMVQRETMKILKEKCPGVKKVEYFTDGCAGQYKNCKSFLNLCHHQTDFGISATWSFFATSHGKSPCDGIGGSVKRTVAKASLQRPYGDPIITPAKMFEFCKEQFSKINFHFICKVDMEEVRKSLETRYELAKTVNGTRSFHQFIPLSEASIATKRISDDEKYQLTFNFYDEELPIVKTLVKNSFVSCVYDFRWYIGVIEEIDNDQGDVKIKCMKPSGPAKSFSWPAKEDVCWIPFSHILCNIQTPLTETGRQYRLHGGCQAEIDNNWLDFQKTL